MNISIPKALLLLAPLAFTACQTASTGGVRIGDTPARRIAKDRSIPGKGDPGKCLPYAMELKKRLSAAGVPAKVVTFSYNSTQRSAAGPASATGLSAGKASDGAHAVVVYDDGGRTYVADNQSWQPKWVPNGSAAELAQSFTGPDVYVRSGAIW